jgi:hypothetical protein
MGEDLESAYEAASGMSKREMFAAMAMQGFVASMTEDDSDISVESIAVYSVRVAHALLAELEKD